MVEVYNECVYDLLVPPSEGHEKLQIQKKGKDVVVPVSDLPSECCVPCIYWLALMVPRLPVFLYGEEPGYEGIY